MKLILLFIALLSMHVSFGQLTEMRKKQLDSVVTNMDRKILRNLDSVHYQLDHYGRNDEEKVFMYYGLFAIHYKYDMDRKGKRHVKEYTPYYTARIRKGVCRDFSALYKELCDRSDIPCLEVTGRVEVPFLESMSDFLTGKMKNPNHKWNVVKFNGEWHLMDPTWSSVERTEKYYCTDSNGRKQYMGKVKIPSRKYYDSETTFFHEKRNVIHPAFYLSDSIATYTTARRKASHQKVYKTNYNYSAVLDSLIINPYHQYSAAFISEMKAYSKKEYYGRALRDHWNFLELKRTSDNPITIETCEHHLKEFEKILSIIETENGKRFHLAYELHKKEVGEYMEKLLRSQQITVRK